MAYTTVKKIAEKWGVSVPYVYQLAREGRILGAELVDGSWLIPEDAEKPAKKELGPRPGYISASEAAKKWGIGNTSVVVAIKDGRVPGAVFMDGIWQIPSDAETPMSRRSNSMPGYMSSVSIAKKWGVSRQYVHKVCQEGRIPGAVYKDKHWHVPADAEKPKADGSGFLSASEIAKKWGVDADKVIWMCQEGVIPDVKRGVSTWLIPQDTVNPLEGYALVSEMAERWGMHRVLVSRACTEGRIPGAKRVGRNWYVPADAEKPLNMKIERKPGYTSATKTAEKWDTSRNFVCEACKEGRIPGAECINGVWHIPEDARNPGRYRRKRK